MLLFSVYHALEFNQKITMEIVHGGFLDTKIVMNVVLAIRMVKLKYL